MRTGGGLVDSEWWAAGHAYGCGRSRCSRVAVKVRQFGLPSRAVGSTVARVMTVWVWGAGALGLRGLVYLVCAGGISGVVPTWQHPGLPEEATGVAVVAAIDLGEGMRLVVSAYCTTCRRVLAAWVACRAPG